MLAPVHDRSVRWSEADHEPCAGVVDDGVGGGASASPRPGARVSACREAGQRAGNGHSLMAVALSTMRATDCGSPAGPCVAPSQYDDLPFHLYAKYGLRVCRIQAVPNLSKDPELGHIIDGKHL